MTHKEVDISEFRNFYKSVQGNEGNRCRYNTGLDTYGCGCQHSYSYCYARSLLHFRGFWNTDQPKAIDVRKIARKANQLSPGTITRLGGMISCFQPCKREQRVTHHTIPEMNRHRIGCLITTKSALIAEPEYMKILDKSLAHAQITVTCLDNKRALIRRKASPPSQRILAIRKLQESGSDVSIHLNPVIEEFMDSDMLSSLDIERHVIGFLRINTWIRRWLKEVGFIRYSLQYGGYRHLPLDAKLKIFDRIRILEKAMCEDVTEYYEYWRQHVNPDREDCRNLRIS